MSSEFQTDTVFAATGTEYVDAYWSNMSAFWVTSCTRG